MLAKKTIKCKIIGLTNIKKDTLNNEYKNFQEFLQLKNIFWWKKDLGENLYSANKQQAERFYKTIKKHRKYPISLRRDLIKIEQNQSKLSRYWLKIPVKLRRKLWVAIRPPKDIDFSQFKICESKLYKVKNDFFVNITIQKEVKIKSSYSSILSIDLGEKVIATSVVLVNQKPQFYGREVRGIRRKYAYIRKNLGKRKLLKEIKRFKNKEQRIVNNILHNISKQIVEQAEQINSVIVLGDLKGIRKSTRGKRFNRIISNMPYLKLTQMITYKANWRGIKVIKISEKGTSKTCSRCGSEGTRPYQGLFKCKKCRYQVNADFNGAKNILNSSLDYMSREGVVVNQPKTHPRDGKLSSECSKDAHDFSRE